MTGEFDVVIASGGSAGAVLASRLSEDGGRRVLARCALAPAEPALVGGLPHRILYGLDRVIKLPGRHAIRGRGTRDRDDSACVNATPRFCRGSSRTPGTAAVVVFPPMNFPRR
jgi:hypothetical protein